MGDEEETSALPPPEGCKPICILNKYMEWAGLKTGENIDDVEPYKLLSKDFLLNSPLKDGVGGIVAAGAICDFTACKQEIVDFPGEEILFVNDPEEKYGENWYMCYTVEAKESIFAEEAAKAKAIEDARLAEIAAKEAKEREERELMTRVYEDKPLDCGKWNSETVTRTEEEVGDLTVRTSRSLIRMEITRPRREFGTVPKFNDRSADMTGLAEFRQHKDPNFTLKRSELTSSLQATRPMQTAFSQTTFFPARNFAAQYEPVSLGEDARRDTLEDPDLGVFLRDVLPLCEEALQQNETVDIFRDEFSALGDDDVSLGNKSEHVMKELRTFTDLEYSKNRSLSCVDWHPRNKQVVAVTCTENLSFDQRVELSGKVGSAFVLIWNFADLIHPQLVLQSPRETFNFRFNPKEPHIIAAGCISGQVLLWDLSEANEALRKKSKSTASEAESADEEREKSIPPVQPLVISTIDRSHKRPVSDLVWLPAEVQISQKGEVERVDGSEGPQQFMTCAGDGQVCVWDLRYKEHNKKRQQRLGSKATESILTDWIPHHSFTLFKEDGVTELGLCRFSYAPEKGDTKLYLTTEEGEMVYADWAAVPEKEGESADLTQWIARDYFRPCVSLERSPFYENALLSVGDWSFNIWWIDSDGLRKPVFSSPVSSSYLTCGRWSTVRPGVLMIARADGSIEVWDLTDQSHRPSATVPVASCAITSMEFWPDTDPKHQQLLAVGDANGNLHVLDVPRNLRRRVTNEEGSMKSFFLREVSRVAYVEQRMVTRAAEREGASQKEEEAEPPVKDAPAAALPSEDKEAELAEAEYLQMEARFKAQLGLGDDGDAAFQE